MVSSGVDSGGRVFTEVRLGPGDWRSAVDKGSGGLTVRHGNTSVLHQTEQVPVLGAGIALGHAVRGDSSAAKRAVASTTGERMVGRRGGALFPTVCRCANRFHPTALPLTRRRSESSRSSSRKRRILRRPLCLLCCPTQPYNKSRQVGGLSHRRVHSGHGAAGYQ